MLGGVFERFTETARQVVVKAQEESRGLRHNHIGTEHLLLGLVFEQDEIADRVLHSFGITPDRARDQLVTIVKPGGEVTAGQIPFTSPAKKVLELGLREALTLRHNSIGTEHLLLGLLAANDDVSMQILRECGVDPNDIRPAVITLLPGPDPDRPRPFPQMRGRADSGIELTVRPDAHVERLLMRACAHALTEGRTEFTLMDLLFALRGDEQAARAMAAVVPIVPAAKPPDGDAAGGGAASGPDG